MQAADLFLARGDIQWTSPTKGSMVYAAWLTLYYVWAILGSECFKCPRRIGHGTAAIAR